MRVMDTEKKGALIMMVEEIRSHLVQGIIPFWKRLRDDENGGYYGYMDYELSVDEKAVKGCILNSRITWFFANAYLLLQDESLLAEARHGYEFMQKYCVDKEKGGVYWSVQYDGTPEDTTKHTYNQAFSIYALSSYYDASKDESALETANGAFQVSSKNAVWTRSGIKRPLTGSFMRLRMISSPRMA